MTTIRLLIELTRALPYFVAWRMAKWVRDVHESRYIDGPISQELVDAQIRELRARRQMNARLHHGTDTPR
jgi:hypothetical protein